MNLADVLILISTCIAVAQLCDVFFLSKKHEKQHELIFRYWYSLQTENAILAIERARKIFNRGFDSVYGKKHFSFRCITRSALFSLFWVFVVLVISHSLGADYSGIGLSVTNYTIKDTFIGFFEEIKTNNILVLLFFQNIVIDYFSLLQTRFLMRRFAFRSGGTVMSVFAFDFILSITLISLPIIAGYYLYNQHFHSQRTIELIDVAGIYLGSGGNKQMALPFVYSTLGSSFMLYILVIASLLIKLLWLAKIPITRTLEWLDEQQHPFLYITRQYKVLLNSPPKKSLNTTKSSHAFREMTG